MTQIRSRAEIDALMPQEITDDNIRWAARVLELRQEAFHGPDGSDPRRDVLKCMDTIDVAACPGSGKTTLLVAKLAILAEKWPHRTRGICVLSHTNVARREIESRLGNTSAGRALLSYPHFVGTIHAFVNEFLAIPWLRSLGYPIKMINTEICQRRRWNALDIAIRSGLETNRHNSSILSIKDTGFGVGMLRWGRGNLSSNTPTYEAIRAACRQTTQEGHFCYEEMFVWAENLLTTVPDVISVLRDRFRSLFVDEAQDNSEQQSAILHRVFMADEAPVVRQRFGDANQAIFNFVGQAGASTDLFPDDDVKRDLPNSYRFGQHIANIANPLGLCPCGLIGQGPTQPLASGASEAAHTLFLFDDDSVGSVLDAYAELLAETFSEQELLEGSFIAVGQVHKDKGDDHCPRHIGHYWPEYDPELSSVDPVPRSFVQYILAGQTIAEAVGEVFAAVEKIAQGLLRLVAMVQGSTSLRARRHSHRYILQLLESSVPSLSCYKVLLSRFALKRKAPTLRAWNDRWRAVVRKIGESIAGCSLTNPEAEAFLAWPDDSNTPATTATNPSSRDNIYRYSKNGKQVAIRIGSVHSVKGETHTATLVVETFYRAHNLDKLKHWIIGTKNGWNNAAGNGNKDRLKVHYVAMTRSTHLLCLAMKKSTFTTSGGGVDDEVVAKLANRGWIIRQL